jgi:hypothetical protein
MNLLNKLWLPRRALILLVLLLEWRATTAVRALLETGGVVATAKLTTDPNGGIAPLGQRIDKFSAIRGTRLAAVDAEAQCKVGRGSKRLPR